MVYQPGLSVMDNNGLYITQFYLSWTMLVGISPSYVCREQHWLVYLFVVDNNGWFINYFVFNGQYWLVYHPVLSVVDNIGWYINWILSVKEIMVGISPDSVCY